MSNPDYLLGRVSSILRQEIASKLKGTESLQKQHEVRIKGETWTPKQMPIETLEWLIAKNIEDGQAMEFVLEEICKLYGDCRKEQISEEDQKMLDYLNRNDIIKQKILDKMNNPQKT